jgi:hypothetical protein
MWEKINIWNSKYNEKIWKLISLHKRSSSWYNNPAREARYVWGAFVQPLLTWDSNSYYIVWVCVCSLIYPACKAYESYYIVICGLFISTFFFVISQVARFGGGGVFEIKRVCWFSLQLLSEIFPILRIIRPDIVINIYMSSCNLLIKLVTF